MLAHLNREQGPSHQVDVRTSELGRHVQTVKPHATGQLRQTLVIGRCQLVGVRIQSLLQGQNLLPHKAPHGADEKALLFGQIKIHARPSSRTQPAEPRDRVVAGRQRPEIRLVQHEQLPIP